VDSGIVDVDVGIDVVDSVMDVEVEVVEVDSAREVDDDVVVEVDVDVMVSKVIVVDDDIEVVVEKEGRDVVELEEEVEDEVSPACRGIMYSASTSGRLTTKKSMKQTIQKLARKYFKLKPDRPRDSMILNYSIFRLKRSF